MRYVFKALPRGRIPADEDLLRLMESFREHSEDLAESFETGMSIEEWRQHFEMILRLGHRTAYEFGFKRARHIDPPPEMSSQVAQEVLRGERQFIDGFEDDLRAGKVKDPGLRMAMYAGRMRGTANGGWIDGLPDDVLITWNLGVGDHCEDCPPLAKGSPYTKQNLWTTPGSNETACLFNCLCWLSVGEEAGFGRVEVWYPPNHPATWAEGSPDDGDGPVSAPAVLTTDGFDKDSAWLYTGDFTVRWGKDPESIREVIRHVFGQDVDRISLARLIAAPGGSEVVIERDEDEVRLSVTEPRIGLQMLRTLGRKGKDLVATQHLIEVDKDERKKRWGVRIVARQLNLYAAHGFARAEMLALGSKEGKSNGYFTWPYIGFRLVFSPEQLELVKDAGFEAVDTHQLFLGYPKEAEETEETEETELSGPGWWSRKGSSGHAVFNLRRGSYHWKILSQYLAERGIRV